MFKILVVEDDDNVRNNISELLTEEGYEVITASDGIDGITFARRFQPDLIISDIILPEADGFTVLKELKTNFLTSTIPFIFLSARTDIIDIPKGLEYKADSYITKPYKAEELLKTIARFLKKK